eukprot:86254-Pleurochrysis_carterae.AAC.1
MFGYFLNSAARSRWGECTRKGGELKCARGRASARGKERGQGKRTGKREGGSQGERTRKT